MHCSSRNSLSCPRWILPFLDALSWSWQLCAAQRSLNRQTTQVHGHQVPLRKHPLLSENRVVFFPLEALPGASTLSHQEDAHLRGKEPESIQDLENLHVGDLGPGLWLNSSNGHSKARKDEAHPGIRHTPECRGHSRRESMLRPHGTKRKHEGKSRASRFLGRFSTTCRGALSRPEIKRSVKKSHPVGVLSLLRRHTHQSLLMSSCGKSSRQYTRSQRKRMKYIMSGCCTNWVSESLCRPPLSRSMASPEWVAFLQKEDTGEEVTSRSPV